MNRQNLKNLTPEELKAAIKVREEEILNLSSYQFKRSSREQAVKVMANLERLRKELEKR